MVVSAFPDLKNHIGEDDIKTSGKKWPKWQKKIKKNKKIFGDNKAVMSKAAKVECQGYKIFWRTMAEGQ